MDGVRRSLERLQLDYIDLYQIPGNDRVTPIEETVRDIVPMLEDQKIGLLDLSPLAGGLLSGKFGPGSNGPEAVRRTVFDFPPVDRDRAWACVDAMRAIGAAKGVSVTRVALA